MKTAFAYLDIENFVVAWGAYRGVLISAHADRNYPSRGCPVSMMLTGLSATQDVVRFANEAKIEVVRQKSFPLRPSRLAAMYFFEAIEDAQKIHGWGGHFSPENLVELELYSTSEVSRHDSNWISYAPLDAAGYLAATDWIGVELRRILTLHLH